MTISNPNKMKLIYAASSQNDLVGVEINMDVHIKIKDKTYAGKVVQTPMTAPINDNKTIQDRNSKSLFINVQGISADVTIGSQSFDPKTQVPPFEVTFDPRDQVRLYGIVTMMIAIGLGVLGSLVSRIRIHQAVKLGEDT